MMDRARRRTVTTAVAVMVAGAALTVPTLAGADPVGGLIDGLGLGGGSAAPKAGVPGQGDGYTPPLHGTNPHGQGTVGAVDLVPGTEEPLSGDPAGGDPTDGGEDVVVGRARGEQNADGTYQGQITILALFGNEILGVDTGEGETAAGPLDPLQDVLDEVCSGSGGQLCLELLKADSSTDGSGSTNSFAVLNAQLGTGENTISAGVANSNGNISDDGSCQTAEGNSSVADAEVLGALSADVLQSESTSTACNGSAPTQSNESQVIALNDTGVPVPAEGCADGTANTEFTPLNPLLAAVCNADDSNGAQAGAPYGVREALSAFVLNVVDDSALVKATTAGSESRAVAPGLHPSGDGDGDGGDAPGNGGNPGAEGVAGNPDAGEDGDGEGAGAGAEAVPGDGRGSLAFTGSELLVLGLLGGALLLGGLMLRAEAGRHRRATS